MRIGISALVNAIIIIGERPYLLVKYKNKSYVLVEQNRRFVLMIANMKRYNKLFEKVVDIDNIKDAIKNSSKGKLKKKEVKLVLNNIDLYVEKIRNMLINGNYNTSKYFIFNKKSGYKIRKIYELPYYPDRIIHHCIVQILKPIWMNLFVRDTYATIPKRGIHDCVKRIKDDLMDINRTKFCLKMDIHHFYPSIDHDCLKQILRRKIKDKKLLCLIDGIIESADGIPIGNYLSQWLANIYLAYFDHYCKEILKCKYYYRYCDDIVILGDNKEKLHYICMEIRKYMVNRLNVSIKDNYQIFPIDKRGIDFLGYRFFHGYTLVRKRIVKDMKKAKSIQSKMSYYGWLCHADSYRLINKYYGNKEIQRFCKRGVSA